ncbi:MAG: DUF45 domain-containing protein [Candidatus Eremiobacteraeota bacterium]|nr:DUF45 domain-containing protein [Candidatus Eremiobacteraeota bacterium]
MKVEVKRSARRRKTISARIIDNRLVLQIPATLTKKEESIWVERMRARLEGKQKELEEREQRKLDLLASEMNQRYLGGKARPRSLVYSSRQKTIFGSCSYRSGHIRISRRVRNFPRWVLSYVVLHELAHLIYPDHSRRFWELLKAYRYTERARAFLSGYRFGAAGRAT